MNKKLGPLPVWAWALIAGGGVGALLLYKHLHEAKAEETPVPELAAQAASPEAGGSSGGGGSAGSLEANEAKESAQNEALREELAVLSEHQQNQGVLGTGIQEIKQAKEALEQLGLVPGSPQTKTEQSSEGAGNASKEAQGRSGPAFPLTSPRGRYRESTYKGHNVHEYAHAIAGGVGPHHNLIVIGGPVKAGHSESPSHVEAAVSAPPASATAPAGFTGWSRDPLVREAQEERFFGGKIKWSRDAATRGKQQAAHKTVFGW